MGMSFPMKKPGWGAPAGGFGRAASTEMVNPLTGWGRRNQIVGHRVSEVLPLLAQHDVTVAQCLIDDPATMPGTCDPSHMPGNWYVHDVPVYGGNQVTAIIGRDKPAPGAGR